MRYLALDIGDVRTGVAASDASGTFANPVKVLPTNEVMNAARPWRLLLEDYEPDVLVCGRPLTLAGEEGAQARKLEEQAEKIARAAGLPVVFVDERLSSAQAKRILREQGMNEKQMRGKVDAVAASIFLQAYLEGLRDTEGE
jgi:putative Holliday junction resolvase